MPNPNRQARYPRDLVKLLNENIDLDALVFDTDASGNPIVVDSKSGDTIAFYDRDTGEWNLSDINIQSLDADSVNTKHTGNVTFASAYDSLQEAINNTNENWVVVDGEFAVDPPLSVPPGVSLTGAAQYLSDTVEKGSKIVPSSDNVGPLIQVEGSGNPGQPHQTEIESIQINEGNYSVSVLINIDTSARSTRYRDLIMRGADRAFSINGAGVKIIGCEMNAQNEYGITFDGDAVRDVTVRDCNFEGFTNGHIRTFSDLIYSGTIRVLNCRFSYYNVSDSNGFLIDVGTSGVGREFAFIVDNCHFFEFANGVDAITISGSSGQLEGPIKIRNNTFVGNDRDTDTATGRRAIQVRDQVQGALEIRNNSTEYFTGPAVINVSNSKSTLEVSDNHGQATFENAGKTSVADGDTIGHALAVEPPIEQCHVSTSSSNRAYVTATDSDFITVALEDPGGNSVSTAETVYWDVSV